MCNLSITTMPNGAYVADSRDIAVSVEKQHKELLRDIRTYCKYLNESKIALVDFFIESSYQDSKGEERPCFLITKKGCDMIANKMTGQKGVVFTALYVNAFYAMENHIKSIDVLNPDKAKALEIKEMNARVRMSNQFLKLANIDTSMSKDYKSILVAKAAQVLAGEEILPLPKSQQKMYTATEIGEMFGVSKQKVGSLANKNNLKTEEYGEIYKDKSPYSSKEVDSFRYNDKAVERFRELLQ